MGLGALVPWRRREAVRSDWPPLSLDEWVSMFSLPGSWSYQQTLGGNEGAEPIGRDFTGLVTGGFETNSIVFACELCRVMHFAEATFKYRRFNNGRPGPLFGDATLEQLEQPWAGGTTGDLLSRMLLHADFGGAAFVTRVATAPGKARLQLLRPDWMTIIIGSKGYADHPKWAPDSELVGYLYQPGGPGGGATPVRYAAEEVAMFAPLPDPDQQFRGMSWLRPVLTDVAGDKAATVHKLKFFQNGATPNMIVNLDVQGTREEFQAWVDLFREGYEGNINAYKTLFLSKAVDTKVVGSDFNQMDFRQTVGVSETRIAACAGVPPVVVGLSEGLQGSSLNAGNYNSARRRFSDGTMRPLWRNAAGSLAQVVTPPAGAHLWYDVRDVAFLKEDEKDQAQVQMYQAQAIRQLLDAGYKPDAVVEAVIADDLQQLVGQHSGLFSVQLQPAGTTFPPVTPNGSKTPAPKEVP
jgi:phage portal protein BeeE